MSSNLSQSATSSSYATVEWLYDLWGCSPQRLGQEPANRWKSSISTAAFYLHVTGLEDCCICIVVFGKRCGDSRGDPVLMRCRGAQDMNVLWCLTFQLDHASVGIISSVDLGACLVEYCANRDAPIYICKRAPYAQRYRSPMRPQRRKMIARR
jgi:hypothetical protein